MTPANITDIIFDRNTR